MSAISAACTRGTVLMILTLAIVSPSRSEAGAVPFDSFQQFAFDGAGPATGCDPADPAGAFCIPSSGSLTGFLDAPPWTFAAPGPGATLLVTDVLVAGDRFEVFDFGAPLGLTSAPLAPSDCGDDPVVCFGTPYMSSRAFILGAGAHEITINSVTGDSGTGYLKVSAIPEPSTSALFVAGALGTLVALRRRRDGLSRGSNDA
jgi:hypothetical protein